MNATEVGVHAPPNGPRDSTILTGPESLSAFRLEPLDPKKVADLRINWDNVVVRERDGRYQLAYGHHRIEAARQELGPDAIVRVIVRNLDDMMIRVMLDENSVVVPDALVMLTDKESNEVLRIQTDAAGRGRFLNLNPDHTFSVHAERATQCSPLRQLGW